jgi:hypothetical protein
VDVRIGGKRRDAAADETGGFRSRPAEALRLGMIDGVAPVRFGDAEPFEIASVRMNPGVTASAVPLCGASSAARPYARRFSIVSIMSKKNWPF